MHIDHIKSSSDNLSLEVAYIIPSCEIKGIVQISHGMSEHKERYFDFMEFLAKNGFICVINDHRGHGKSVKDKKDLGFFYTEDINYIINDLHDVTLYIKNKYPNYKQFLFSHSMGTLVARGYIQKYDNEIDKLILCGPPTKNPFTDLGIGISKIFNTFQNNTKANKLLNYLTFNSYNKGYNIKNEWLTKNIDNVNAYNLDELCGFIFTTNGFINLYHLLKNAYCKKMYQLKNKSLKIFIIAGSDDPVIQSKNKFEQLELFLNELGYKNTQKKLYNTLRHEILNEKEYCEVYNNILDFFND